MLLETKLLPIALENFFFGMLNGSASTFIGFLALKQVW